MVSVNVSLLMKLRRFVKSWKEKVRLCRRVVVNLVFGVVIRRWVR